MFSRKSLIAVIIFCLFLGCSRKNDDHYNTLGVNYLDNGQNSYAIDALKKAVKLNPSNAEAHFNLGRGYKRVGMDEKARAEFSISTRINPEIFNECVKKYREEIDYELTDTQNYSELGNAYAEKGMIDDAIDAYKKVISIEPENARAHYSLGTLYSKKGMYTDAADEFWMAVEIDPDMSEAHYNLGIAYAKKGDMENAVQRLRKAIEINPDNPDAHLALGIIYRAKWKVKESEREFSIYKRLKSGAN